MHTLYGHMDDIEWVVFSPDGRLLASGSWDHMIKLWEIDSGKRVLPWPVGEIRALALSPQGDRLAVCDRQGQLSIWNPATGAHLSSFPASAELLALSPAGRLLAYASGSDITVLDLAKNTSRTLSGHTAAVTALAFSRTGAASFPHLGTIPPGCGTSPPGNSSIPCPDTKATSSRPLSPPTGTSWSWSPRTRPFPCGTFRAPGCGYSMATPGPFGG